jgi:predicted SAM-dependent methyltransferase
MKLNIGCGPVQPDGWVNIDNSNRAWLASKVNWLDAALVRCRVLPPTEFGPKVTIANLLKRWPFPDNSCEAVYAGDVWEHFTREQADWLTREAFRVLRPGGVLRLRTPDGAKMFRNYLAAFDAAREATGPERDRHMLELRRWLDMYFRDLLTRKIWLGSIGHYHKWHWDEVQLCDLLQSVGFVDVSRRAYHDSRIEDVELVEVFDYLQVEGVKR